MRNVTRNLMLTLAALGLWVSTAAPSWAGQAFTLDNLTGLALANSPATDGFRFAVNEAIAVTQLGLFDSGQDGPAESHEIGLWDSNGSLLVSATIAAGQDDPLINQFRYVNIPEVILMAGQQYNLGALYRTGADPFIFPSDAVNIAAAPQITFLASAFEAGGTLSNPINSVSILPAYFGPNFTFRAVPEPGTLASAAFAVLTLVGSAQLRRRASQASTL